MSNKRGWIRIVEAFIAVMLIAGVLLYVINQGHIGQRDISEQVYRAQIAVLREISLNSAMRLNILQAENGNVPPSVGINDTINERMPDYLECTALICPLNDICSLTTYYPGREIYAQSVAISAEGTKYGPKQLRLFCWTA